MSCISQCRPWPHELASSSSSSISSEPAHTLYATGFRRSIHAEVVHDRLLLVRDACVFPAYARMLACLQSGLPISSLLGLLFAFDALAVRNVELGITASMAQVRVYEHSCPLSGVFVVSPMIPLRLSLYISLSHIGLNAIDAGTASYVKFRFAAMTARSLS